jgi:hypothetical protein
MFCSYATDTTSMSSHKATVKERVQAARYQSRDMAEHIIDNLTSIGRANPFLYDHAVACVQELAGDYQRGVGFGYVRDGMTVAEQLAALAVESLNETLCEAMVS